MGGYRFNPACNSNLTCFPLYLKNACSFGKKEILFSIFNITYLVFSPQTMSWNIKYMCVLVYLVESYLNFVFFWVNKGGNAQLLSSTHVRYNMTLTICSPYVLHSLWWVLPNNHFIYRKNLCLSLRVCLTVVAFYKCGWLSLATHSEALHEFFLESIHIHIFPGGCWVH